MGCETLTHDRGVRAATETLDPLVAWPRSLASSPAVWSANLSAEAVTVEVGEPYGRSVGDVRDLLVDGPPSDPARTPGETDHQQEVSP